MPVRMEPSEVEIDVVSVGEIDGKLLSPPVHTQVALKHLNLQPLLQYIQGVLKDDGSQDTKPSALPYTQPTVDFASSENVKLVSGVPITKAERFADRTRLYNFSRVRKKRKWMKTLLVEDSSDEEDSDRQSRVQNLLKIHKYRKTCAREFRSKGMDQQIMYYSSSVLSNIDQHKERLDSESEPKVKTESSHQTESQASDEECEDGEDYNDWLRRRRKRRRLTPEQAQDEQKNIWSSICKFYIPTMYKTRQEARKDYMTKLRRVSAQCMRECRRVGLQSQRTSREGLTRAKKLAREAGNYWRKKDKMDRETRRKNEKEADEQRKQDMALMEAQRQKRKLNFLITQTELYAHFMARKITGRGDEYQQKLLEQLSESEARDSGSGDSSPYDARALALSNAEDAYGLHMSKRRAICNVHESEKRSSEHCQQPVMFNGILKSYQLDGLKWLIRLYEEGLNGILADEMGLGKTIQSLALLGHLAESWNIWGPFLIVAPASTLHNWQQECARFLPKFKCVPYWGNAQDRKVLRKFWETAGMCTEEGSFHVVITSYQIVIQDVKYFQKVDWHYMVLDEAQAIKSSASARWKILLAFSCRNRLLLTGTPIQNNMAELWALLHFIMPTLFDCHEEFNEWFSKDIESHAENKAKHFDQSQLSRLHSVLSPFMLRREKKDVENQLSDKIEKIVHCSLTSRQKILYEALKNKISIDDLLCSSRASTQTTTQTNTLMNLVMQFRKVCNHPDLIDRRETQSGLKLTPEVFILPRLLYTLFRPELAHALYNTLYIHHPQYVAESLRNHRENDQQSAFSFIRFIGLSPMNIGRIYCSLMYRWLQVLNYWTVSHSLCLDNLWQHNQSSRTMFLLEPLRTTSPSNVMTSLYLSTLVFTSTLMTSHGHVDTKIMCMSETYGHRRIRLRTHAPDQKLKSPKSSAPVSPSRSPIRVLSPSKSAPVSPTKLHRRSAEHHHGDSLLKEEKSVHRHKERPDRIIQLLLTDWPKFTYLNRNKVHFPPRTWYCPDRAAEFYRQNMESCCSLEALQTLLYGSPDLYRQYENRTYGFGHCTIGGLLGVQPIHGYSGIVVPDKETLVTDAGKLHVLDKLLNQLKKEGHRVLIYSQMTRMIDILEEYMWHRKHTYIRLDGSSKISERRDMVADFQNRQDIFVFLLSTRAGGLGINLTAADTVIFYDSDWNPTVDAQAMDRAHRLGQTRQVTVYRLVTGNTIEQRILERAKAKSQIQSMVMKGSAVRPDALKPTEVVSLLLDDEEMQHKFNEKQKDSKGGRRSSEWRKRAATTMDDDRESVVSSTATSPISVVSDHTSLLHNESSNDALFIAEEAGGSNDPSPKRRGRPPTVRMGTPKRAAAMKSKSLKTESSGVEIADGVGSRTASLRTRSANQAGTQGENKPQS